jgi:hypothetical protein
MRKILNYTVAFIGCLLLVSGLLKTFASFNQFKIQLDGVYLSIPSVNTMFYNIVVNFIGGLAMLQHAISTLNFNKRIFNKQSGSEIFDSELIISLKGISKLTFISGLIITVISFWHIVRSFILLSAFTNMISAVLPLFIFVLTLFIAYSILPLLLVFKNYTLNSKIDRLLYEEKIRERMDKLNR